MTGESVLVVEDEGLIALHLTELLEKAGYRVTGPVYSGELAIKAIAETPSPDLILMDIGLAGLLDGIETARQIRQQYAIPLVFLTAYSSERILQRVQEIAPEGYLIKPVMDKELLEAIRGALALHSRK